MSRQRALSVARATVPVLSGLAAVAGVLGEVGPPVQPALVFWFVLVCPGLSFVGVIRPPSLLFALTLSIAVSCALAVTVAQGLLYAGAWSPVTALLVLVALSAVGTVLDLRAGHRTRHLPVDSASREGG